MRYLPRSETGSKLMLRVWRHCLQRLFTALQKLPTMQRIEEQDPTKCSIEKVYCTKQITMLVLWKSAWACRSREPLQELWKSSRRGKESYTIESSSTREKRICWTSLTKTSCCTSLAKTSCCTHLAKTSCSIHLAKTTCCIHLTKATCCNCLAKTNILTLVKTNSHNSLIKTVCIPLIETSPCKHYLKTSSWHQCPCCITINWN